MFVSLVFPILLGVVVALFFLLPIKWRPAVLLIASYVLCGRIDLRALVVLVFISFCAWITGIRIEKARIKEKKSAAKTWAGTGVVFFIFCICIYKYLPYFLQRAGLESQLPENLLNALVIPVGLSFYLFQAIGYLIDIYKGKSSAEKSFLYLGLYFAFFPKLISGPIERPQDFLPQIKTLSTVKFKDRGRLSTAFTYMLWGYFMKLVVADRLALVVNQIFESPEVFDSVWLVLGVFFYTMQIYCDFAGYSYIAIGCARIFGIKLTHNFEAPYLSGSISEFWRRWHISLGSWLRDYVYIPLGGNRKGNFRKCINMLIVFLICGMWHGAGVHFLVWGLLHGMYSVIEIFWKMKGWKVKGGQIFTFISVAFAWIFFKVSGCGSAIKYIAEIMTSGIQPFRWKEMVLLLHLNLVEIALIVVGILVIWGVDILCDKKQMHLPILIQQKQNAARYFIFYLLIVFIFIFGMYGPGYHAEQFIYMQF